jgi:endonuclease YncB( thermonuclease family)
MYEYKVISVNKIVDGDTVDVTIDLGFYTYIRHKVRIVRINSPELHSVSETGRDRANKARGFAEQWFSSHNPPYLFVKTKGWDKYGRMLGDFYSIDDRVLFSEAAMNSGFLTSTRIDARKGFCFSWGMPIIRSSSLLER